VAGGVPEPGSHPFTQGRSLEPSERRRRELGGLRAWELVEDDEIRESKATRSLPWLPAHSVEVISGEAVHFGLP
jgi:hypothetical protein